MQFDVRDGLGIALLRAAGVKVWFVSHGAGAAVTARAKSLGLEESVMLEVARKDHAIAQIREVNDVQVADVVYVGDDLWDLEARREVGVLVAVYDSVPDLRRRADWVTRRPGGRGAVREVADAILSSKRCDIPRLLDRVRQVAPAQWAPE